MEPGLERSFVAFASARLPALTQAAFLLTGDRHRAEDLVQTALARSYAAWDRIERADPEAYVRQVMLNAYRSWCRRRPWREAPSDVVVEQADAAARRDRSPDHAADQAERDLVWRALAALSPQQRAVVVLRYYEDRSDDEIAELLGCSVGTVKRQSARALTKLRAPGALGAERLPVRWPVAEGVLR
ncbi:MAG: SigE family RNA polymerase sigma factor [Frankiaceae bacterium]